MKLYDAMTPNSLRLNVFLAEKNIDVPRVPVDVMGGGTRTPAFLAINSLGELPALELGDGRVLTESVAICRFFEERHPDPNLMGNDAEETAFIEMWNRRMEQQIFDAIGHYGRHTLAFFADKVEQIPAYAASLERRFEQNLAWLDGEMSDGRPFVTGTRLTIADITGMAALFVSDIVERPVPKHLANVKRWERNLRMRPSFAGQFAKAA